MGNHRPDAAVELALERVPAEVRYLKHVGALVNCNLSRQFDWQALPEGVHHVPRNALDELHTVDCDASHPSVRSPRRMRDVPRKYRAEAGRAALARQLDPLVEDVRRRGVVEPIEVRRSSEALEVVDGNHRYVAARRARARTVPVRIEDAPWARGRYS